MKIIKRSLTTVMFISLMISTSTSSANQSREEKIQEFKQKNHQKEDEIAAKSTQFITDLKEKYPQFNDEQLDSMRLTFEESLLENVDYTPKNQPLKSDTDAFKSKKISSKEKLQGEVSQLVNKNVEKEHREADKDVIKEADITVVSLTVKQGDTLGDIAQRTYGDSSMYIAIYEENKDQLSSPNKIPEGIILRVPKIDNSMRSKFSQLVKETQKKPKATTVEPPEKEQAKRAESEDTQQSPEELNRLISEAVSKSIRN